MSLKQEVLGAFAIAVQCAEGLCSGYQNQFFRAFGDRAHVTRGLRAALTKAGLGENATTGVISRIESVKSLDCRRARGKAFQQIQGELETSLDNLNIR
ncbi:MAG: hypothetical protein GC136_10315 [Alphaproteobacteria bacterium]|nr:hypothetical protein [Alphaproteobacteria bacterium]